MLNPCGNPPGLPRILCHMEPKPTEEGDYVVLDAFTKYIINPKMISSFLCTTHTPMCEKTGDDTLR